MVNVVREVESVRRAVRAARTEGNVVALVPTMGALHRGHLSLVDIARRIADTTVVSIFVNPLQFGPAEDLHAYPRDEEGDLEAAERHGVDLVFAPTDDEMYPEASVTTVDVGELGSILEGAERPGHFAGVATVVAKLFNAVEPDVAVFGQKDAQQVAVIKKMVRDLAFGIRIEVGETIREPDGLALSSRNAYLKGADRERATALYRALNEGRDRFASGGGPQDAEAAMLKVLDAEGGVGVGYARAVDPVTFREPHDDVLLVVAARVGPARLIDNMLVSGAS